MTYDALTPARLTRAAFASICLVVSTASPSFAVDTAHSEGVQCIAASPDGKALASGGFDRMLRIWDLKSGKEARAIHAHKILVSALAFSPDGKLLASGGWDKVIRVWDAASGKKRIELTEHTDLISWLAFGSKDSLISASRDGTVRVFGLKNGKAVTVWKPFGGARYDDYESWNWRHPKGRISVASLCPDRRILAVSSAKEVKLWDWKKEGVLQSWEAPAEVKHLAVGKGGKSVVGVVNGRLLIWDGSGKIQKETSVPGRVLSLAVSTDRKSLALGRSHHRTPPVQVFSIPDLKPGKTANGLKGRVGALAFSADGELLFSGDWNCRLRQWNAADGIHSREFARKPIQLVEPEPFQGESDLMPLDRWRCLDELGCVVPEKRDGRAGFRFLGKSTWFHQAARDYAWTRWEPGTDAWELSFRLRIDENIGGNYQGIWVGLSTAPPERMGKDDITAMIRISMNGIHADVRQGNVYELGRRGRARFGVTGAGFGCRGFLRKAQLSKAEAKHTYVCQIRRDGERIQFSMFGESAEPGQRAIKTVEWAISKKHARLSLPYVIIKRIPQKGEQPSVPSWELRGFILELKARLNPPGLREVLPWQGVLGKGSEVVLRADRLADKSRAFVGGKPAELAKTDGSDRWSVKLPDLPAGRHDLLIRQPNGLWSALRNAVPCGRLLLSAVPFETALEGGDTVTLRGAGLAKDTVVLFGETKSEVLEVPGPGTLTVKAPPGKAGRTEIRCEHDGKAFKGRVAFGYAKHPYLFFDEIELKALREACRKPPLFRYLEALLKQADKRCALGKLRGVNKATDSLKCLVWAWALTGDEKYKKPIKTVMRSVWDSEEVLDFRLMVVGMMAFSYDVLYSELTADERTKTQAYLRRALDTYLAEARKHRWFFTNMSNTCAVGNSGGGLAAMALINSHPRAEEAISFAKHWCREFADRVFGPEGSCTEGRLYWAYGLGHYLIFADALRRVKDDASLLDHPHLKQNYRYVESLIGGYREQFLMFNDDYPTVADSGVCAMLGARHKQPFMIQVADRHPARTRMPGFDLLWRSRYTDSTPEGEIQVPTLSVVRDIHCGIMRSEGTLNPALVVGVKGSEGPTTHHRHADSGSFVLHARGERVLIDPGYGKRPHSVVLLKGRGPDRTGGLITDVGESGDVRAAVIDSTKAFSGRAQRVRRNIVMCGKEWVVVLDEIRPLRGAEKDARLLFLAGQTKGTAKGENERIIVEKNGERIVRIRNTKSSVFMTTHGAVTPPTIKAAGNDHFFSPKSEISSVIERFEAPLVTVIEVADREAKPRKAEVKRGADAVEVRLPGATALTFKKSSAGWGLVLDGKVLASQPKHPYAERSLKCAKAAQPPDIDGRFDDAIWKGAQVANGFINKFSWKDERAAYPVAARLAWDEKNLYAAITCDAPAKNDEIHFLLVPKLDGQTLFRLVFRVGGKTLKDFWGARNRFDDEIVSKIRVEKDKWFIEAQLSWKGFETTAPAVGSRFKLNLARYRSDGGIEKTQSQWSATRGVQDDGSIMFGYGELFFE